MHFNRQLDEKKIYGSHMKANVKEDTFLKTSKNKAISI